jgi:heme-degrading monooxygenase HmoA
MALKVASSHTGYRTNVISGGIDMFARMTRWEFQPSPEQVEKVVQRNRDQVMPAARALPGFRGFYSFVDPDHGTAVTLTLWESEETAQKSDEAANRLRAQTSQNTGITMISAERYEVAVHSNGEPARVNELPVG